MEVDCNPNYRHSSRCCSSPRPGLMVFQVLQDEAVGLPRKERLMKNEGLSERSGKTFAKGIGARIR